MLSLHQYYRKKRIRNAFSEQLQIAIISDAAIFHVAVTLLERVRSGGDAVCCTLAVTAEIGFSRASTYLLLEKNNVSQGTRVITLFLVASYSIFRIMIKACYWEAIFLLNTKHGTGRHTLVPFALVVKEYWKRYQVWMLLTVSPLLVSKDMPNTHYHLTWSLLNQLTLIESVLLLTSGHL